MLLEISDVLFGEKISDEMLDLFEGKNQVIDELIRRANEGEEGPWLKNNGGLSKVIHDALRQTIDTLSDRYGDNMSKWQWGDEHKLQFSHPLSSVSPLQHIFNSKDAIPVSGSAVTVQAARRNDETGIVNHGASWRYVIDTSDMTKAYHIVGPGQSGHFKSKWYDNQFEDWATGDYHVTTLNVPINEKQTLILLPN